MSTCISFAPLVDDNCKILILGSMPGVASLEAQQYYAHKQNRFWKLMALLLGEDMPLDYEAKKAMLLAHHIALWDTLGYCEREGSLDSDIKNEVPNDILQLLDQYPHITTVICNGGKAGAAFKKYFAKEIPAHIAVHYLHSTSPANARMRLEDLAVEWDCVKK